MSDVFEEVESDLRREHYMSWFRRYGLWALAAVALVLLGIGGWQAYKSFRAKTAGEYAQQLAEGQKLFLADDLHGAERFYTDMAKSAPGPYKTAALQFVAEALYQQGDAKGALQKLDEAAEAAHDKFLRDAAKLKAAYVASDVEDYKTVAPRLNALIDGGGQLSYLAREALGAKAYEAGDIAAAREHFDFLSKALEAPNGVRERAHSALALIGPDAPQSAAPATSAAKPGANP